MIGMAKRILISRGCRDLAAAIMATQHFADNGASIDPNTARSSEPENPHLPLAETQTQERADDDDDYLQEPVVQHQELPDPGPALQQVDATTAEPTTTTTTPRPFKLRRMTGHVEQPIDLE